MVAAVGIYVVLAFLASGVLLGAQSNSGLDPAALTLPQFGPAISAVVTALIFRRRLRDRFPAAVSSRRAGRDLLILLAGCALLIAVVLGLLWGDGTSAYGPQAVGGIPFALFVILQLIGAAGEEAGWRGFLQPVLENRYGRLLAVPITGIVWALWHVQAFTQGPAVAASFLVSTVAFAYLLGWSANGSAWQRISIASIGHWIVNVELYLAVGDETQARPQVIYTAVGAVVAAVAAVGLHALGRRPAYSPTG
ncbi:membrane protease YdiL (CAAX protease family) [Nocardia pseudobrasiliensis]|uniref:Membrane protease YdiL (CAAX protease family) n=1 Tax=Nocardia pseudobrasiliensis TaxID=45979 RepID=A0A370IBI3_9NOCA|nr:membrane protease YdiL (CAAX protease family) [Nocardia pseudobrasiliensis]